MTLTPRWESTTDADARVRYCRPGVVCVGISDSRHGPAVRILSAATGNERGRVDITGQFRSAVYREAPGLLFVTTREDDVYAVDPETGKKQWEANAAAVGPATAEMVYTYGGATVWAVRAADGTREWTAVLPDAVSSVHSPDRLDGETLRLTVGDHRDTSLVGIDAGTGTERFHHQSPDVKEYLVDGRTILALVEDEYQVQEVVRIDERTGGEQWSHTLADPGNVDQDTVEVRDDAIYLGTGEDGGITVLDPVTGRVMETLEGYSGLFFHSGMLYSAKNGAADSLELHAIDPGTRRVAWRTGIDHQLTGIAFDGESEDLYLSGGGEDEPSTVYRINGATGQVRWECPIGETVDSMLAEASPLLAHSSLHPMMAGMFSDDGRADQSIYAIDKQRGRAVWNFSVESADVRAATDRHVVIPDDGKLFVLDRDDGRIELDVDYDDYDLAADALFTATETTLSAYPLSETSAAFSAGGAATDDDGDTAIYDDTDTAIYDDTDAATRETDLGAANTSATERRSEDDDETSPSEGATRAFASSDSGSPSFCPGCGTDLGSHADASFCPDCGANFTD
ncbi:PQQ-binding-like beta-propeller repeat protein [Halobellus ordinarius]|uniref:outer membrane protein assembly factor BamB family protein n=1 Tax=Halobellus ordinarius TaxID=3075120 RepID=UPI0028803D52|nr:PQQ-binding-like beta-propeller repeat protein [Halobellus sp. ZY16]